MSNSGLSGDRMLQPGGRLFNGASLNVVVCEDKGGVGGSEVGDKAGAFSKKVRINFNGGSE